MVPGTRLIGPPNHGMELAVVYNARGLFPSSRRDGRQNRPVRRGPDEQRRAIELKGK